MLSPKWHKQKTRKPLIQFLPDGKPSFFIGFSRKTFKQLIVWSLNWIPPYKIQYLCFARCCSAGIRIWKRWKTTLNAGSFRRYYLQIHLSSRTKKPSIHKLGGDGVTMRFCPNVRSTVGAVVGPFAPTVLDRVLQTHQSIDSWRRSVAPSTGGNTTQATTWELTNM